MGGTSTTVQVTMTADTSVHALFERIELTVQKQGQGDVTASPPGGQVSVPFTEGYGTGDPVTLQATAAPGWGFKQWMGEVTPSGATATTTMHSSKTVTAVFAQATLDVDKEGEGTVSVSQPGGVQTLPFSETYSMITLLEIAAKQRAAFRSVLSVCMYMMFLHAAVAQDLPLSDKAQRSGIKESAQFAESLGNAYIELAQENGLSKGGESRGRVVSGCPARQAAC